MYSARFSACVPMSPTQPPRRSLRVGAPGGLLLAAGFEARGEPALRILDDHLADLAELAFLDHVARLLHQRIAGVIVRQPVDQAALLHDGGEFLRFLQVQRGGLVAQHMEAVFQRHLGRREVHVVRRDDGDEVHALIHRQCGLGLDHLLEAAVAAARRQEEIRTAGLGALGVGGEGAADEFDLLIDGRRDAMHRADEGPAPAAHHAVTNFPCECVVGFGLAEGAVRAPRPRARAESLVLNCRFKPDRISRWKRKWSVARSRPVS